MQTKALDRKYCVHDGCLVGRDGWIPDAKFDRNVDQWFDSVGCNNIHCNNCKEFVRHRSDYEMGPYTGRDERTRAPILFATEDWSALGFLKPATIRVSRIYYCKCFCCTQSNWMPLDGSNDHLIYGASYCTDWHCHGHPPLTIPTEVYGVPLNKPSDLKAAVMAVMSHREVLHDALPRGEIDPEAFLINRLYPHLDAVGYKKPIDQLMASFLKHPESLFRSVACKHLEKFPASPVACRLVNAYRQQPALFDGVLHPQHKRGANSHIMRDRVICLGHQFQKALLAYLNFSKSRTAQKLLRELILSGKIRAWWGPFREDIGLAWIDAHWREIYVANIAEPIRALSPLLAYGDVKDVPMRIARAQQLKQMKLIPEKAFLDAVPREIKEGILAKL